MCVREQKISPSSWGWSAKRAVRRSGAAAAFLISELQRSEIGSSLLPFLIIDIVVASEMGMVNLPPSASSACRSS